MVLEHGQTEVGNAAGHVVLDKDVLALYVPVCDGRLGLRPVQLCVQVGQSAARRDRHLQHHFRGHGLLVEEVVERPKLVVLGDEPQLRHSVVGDHVAGKEAQDVVVPQEQRVEDLRLPDPRLLVARRKLLHGHRLTLVVAEEHLPIATVADGLCDSNSASHRPLNEEGQPRATARGNRHVNQIQLPR